MTALIVFMEFNDGPRIDIVSDMSESEAIVHCFGIAMQASVPPPLPLFRYFTAKVPDKKMQALVNGIVLEPVIKPEPLTINVRAALAAFSDYVLMNEPDADNDVIEKARDRLRSFFEPMGIKLYFGDP